MRINFTRKGVRRYRYYVSAALLDGHGTAGSLPRVTAGALDGAVLSEITPLLDRHWRPDLPPRMRAVAALKHVRVSVRSLQLTLLKEAVDPLRAPTASDRSGEDLVFDRAISLARPHNATTIVRAQNSSPRIDRTLVRAVALAHLWAKQLESGDKRSIVHLVENGGRCIHYTKKLLPLAYLAPDLVEMILEGRQPPSLTLSALTAQPLPLQWDAQRALVERL
jgi:hypothetical protein